MTYIVLLNYCAWKSSIVALESLFHLTGDYRVILCDNASPDGSLRQVELWARGLSPVDVELDAIPRAQVEPEVPKPIAATVLSRPEAESGCRIVTPLTLVQNGVNKGAAAGHNVGIRLAMTQRDCQHVWILGCDTVVDRNALRCLLERMEGDPSIGMCGSRLLDLEAPHRIQTVGGGRWNVWTGCGEKFCEGMSADTAVNVGDLEPRFMYVDGPSMLVSRRFLDEVGPMPETTFLHYEELSWCIESRGRFRLAAAADSVVYHRNRWEYEPGSVYERTMYRGMLSFACRYRPMAIPLVLLRVLCVALWSLATGNGRRAAQFLDRAFWASIFGSRP